MIGRIRLSGNMCQPAFSDSDKLFMVDGETGRTRRDSVHWTKGCRRRTSEGSVDEAASSPKHWFNALVRDV